MVASSVLPPNAPLVGPDGRVTREWYSYFVSLTATADGASSGEVATNPGSGLAGGGQVSGGISLSIDDNGVTNSKIRQSAGCSIIGRRASSTGNVADIAAGLNDTTLVRQGNQVFFSSELKGATLTVNETATAAVVVQSHHIPITISGVTFKLLLST